MPPPPKKERRERSERTDKDRPDGEGERANGEGRPEGERPETVGPEGDAPEKEKSDKEQPIKEKPDTEKEISPAVTKKPGSKKTRSVHLRHFSLSLDVVSPGRCPHRCVSAPPQTQIRQPSEPTQRQTQHTVRQIGDQDQQELSHFQVRVTLVTPAPLRQKSRFHIATQHFLADGTKVMQHKG